MTEGRKFFSLRSRFVFALAGAVALALSLGLLTSGVGKGLIETVYLNEENSEARCRATLDRFQDYVTSQELNVDQAREITGWAKEQNYLYLMVSDREQVLVDSGWWNDMSYFSAFEMVEAETFAATEEAREREDTQDVLEGTMADQPAAASLEPEYEESYGFGTGSRPVVFGDGTYLVSVYDFSEEPLYELVNVTVVAVMLIALFGVMTVYHNSVTRRIIHLSREVEQIAEGDLTARISVRRGDEIGELASHVDKMRYAIIKEMRAEQEAWNANSDLITRMSHDIRTPLTVLIGFLELLEDGNYSEDEAYQDYLGICRKNAFQMKELAEKLFQYFLVFGHGASKISLEPTDAKTLLYQLLGEHTMLLREQEWQIDSEMEDIQGLIEVDPFHTKRLFDNLFSNIKKYADPSRPVKVRLAQERGQVLVTLKNGISREGSRAESTNMGLKTCERIAELMKGTFRCDKTEESFVVRLSLPILKENEE